MIEQFLKFCIVGGSGVFVDFGITYLCKEWLRLNKYVANSLGFLCASTTNYIHLFTKSSSENTAHLAESMPFLILISEIFSSNMFSQYSMLLIFPQSDNDLFVLIMAIIKTTAQRSTTPINQKLFLFFIILTH